jgi:DNA-binding NarL/FixJ family response regulator
MIRILLAEDHETVREGLRMLLNSQPDLTVVAEAGDGDNAVEKARALKPDVVVLDLTMPKMSGLTAAKTLRDSEPSIKLVALTRHDDQAYVREMLAIGASAYVLKQSPSTELLTAVRAAAAGASHLDPALGEVDSISSRRRATVPSITAREQEVLRHVAVGLTNKEIAALLDVSVKTVEVHKANAMRKLNLKGRVDVVRYAVLNGWLQDPGP